MSRRVDIQQDSDDEILIMQDVHDGTDVIICTPEQAIALAHRLMSFGAGQGPRETETIDEKGNIRSVWGHIIRPAQ